MVAPSVVHGPYANAEKSLNGASLAYVHHAMSVYWLMSIGAWKGFIQLCYKPQYWEKTEHGFCAYDPATEDEVGGSEAAFRLANEAYAEV